MNSNAPRPKVKPNSAKTVNEFYTSFDKETNDHANPDEYRTPFEVDRDRIIHSYAFRRLQGKTQVFTTGEYDFYRTRLTHTIEVAQIGRSICAFLNRTTKGFSEKFYIDPSLVEAVCLAHDIGHAPFGHMGEEKLNELMDRFGGFEGNAKTLRLLTETIWPSSNKGQRRGMDPTRALLDGVLKCKRLRSRVATKKKKQKKFIYYEQKKYLDYVHKALPRRFLHSTSIESQIMDWADEIAYSTADVLDGVYARFITAGKLKVWESPERDDTVTTEVIDSIEKEDLQRFRGQKIGELIKSVSLAEDSMLKTGYTNRYQFRLDIPNKTRAQQKCLSQISRDLVFASPGLQQLQYKAQALIEQLFDVLSTNYLSRKPPKHLLSQDEESMLAAARNKRERARLLCDYISGMSDDYIVRTCRRLTDPEFGSIVDLV
jgi:dGTPase